MEKEEYIYESPDGGETIYRRKFQDYINRKQLNLFDSSVQLELFDEWNSKKETGGKVVVVR